MLGNILSDIEAEEGLSTAVGETDRATTLLYVNKAALQIWQLNDFEEWMAEAVFDVNVPAQTISFPSDVGRVRGIRYYDGRNVVELQAKRNRYNRQIGGANEVYNVRWRDRGISPLCRTIENAARIILSIPAPMTFQFDVTIVGKNANKNKIVEVVTFHAGDTEVQTTNIFSDIESISKLNVTDWDVSIYDVDNNIISVLGNNQFKTSYKVVQIIDSEDQENYQNSSVEMLFKRNFQPMAANTDSFFNTDEYDAAIVAKYCELWKKDKAEKAYYRGLSQQLINDTQADKKIGQKEKIDFHISPWFNLHYGSTYRRRRC